MELVQYTTENKIAFITLNRPEKRNALSYEMVEELKKAFLQAEEDMDVKIVVLKANGNVFCAGADLAALQKMQTNSYEENLADSRHLKELYDMIYHLKKVVIAQVHGHALAGGCGLASVCDFSFASSEAKFGYTEVKIGFVPALVMVFLIRKIGEGYARKLLLSGEMISAEEAKSIGLINEVVEPGNLDGHVKTFVRGLATGNSGEAMMLTKKMISEISDLALTDALEFAANVNAKARHTEDCQKGISSFLNKTKVQWD